MLWRELALRGLNEKFPAWINTLKKMKNNEFITAEEYSFLTENHNCMNDPEIAKYQKIHRENINTDTKTAKLG